ncbi:avidin/streptavidin family protein [Hugenholtzia roseola]|uniref:avidin/streptavidin family protein n=1 Tax=Hugenholtzia roseola TaxID=1002 RepID=UPI0003F65459|nr:avidin/streptavidin family protein [Hugenholtzia roseola]
MQYTSLVGTWQNEFGSLMTITYQNPDSGYIIGTYSSHTGATGVYYVIGITDIAPDPNVNSQTVAFSVSWRNTVGPTESGANWVSAFAGQVQVQADGSLAIATTYLLQENTNPADNWSSTIVAPSTFRKISDEVSLEASWSRNKKYADVKDLAQMQKIAFGLQMGSLSDNGATPWYAQIGLGTPAQDLKFMLDTGTDNTWITSTACTTAACLAHNRYNPQASSTFKVIDPNPTQKSFGPWGTMTVIIGEDIFTLEQIDTYLGRNIVTTNEQMNFEVTTFYNGYQFQQLACDGGIAIPSPYWKSDGRTEALMIQLYKDAKISYLCASFYTNKAEQLGECLFGGIDIDKFNINTLQWLSLKQVQTVGLEYLWDIQLTNFLVNGFPVQAGITDFVLDTGSSYFKGPQDLIQILINAVTYNGELPTYVTSESALSQYPTIGLQIGSQTYYLQPQDYFLQLSPQYWELGIQVLDGMPEGMLLVGSVFLDTVYSIFDFQNPSIGLARLLS